MLDTGLVLQNRYLIGRQIGAGGMGAVYLATDRRFGSTVAIKETFFLDAALRRAFEREAQLLNGLRHPALPRVSDHFEEANGLFLVMEYIAGEDLCETLEREGGSFAVADVLQWADQLLDALDYLHNQKTPIVHRDIKPQNLKLTPRGQIVLLDFGLAKGSITDVSKLTQTKSVFGYSRAYAPLEQIQGTGTDPRSDLYSLAATVYHLLIGSAPVDALTRAMAVLNGGEDSLHPANELNPKVSASVAAVLHQAMSLNPNLRPKSAAAMRRDLKEAEINPNFEPVGAVETARAKSSALFTQKTELMGGQTDGNQTGQNANLTAPLEASSEDRDSELTKINRTKLDKQQFATNPQANAHQTQLEKAVRDEQNAAIKVPVAAKAAENQIPNAAPAGNQSRFKAFGIAAAVIAILAGGGFAGWYAMSDSAAESVNQKPTAAEAVLKNEPPKSETVESKPDSNASVQTPVTPDLQIALPANTSTKPQTNPASQPEAKQNAQTGTVEKNDKQQPPKQNAATAPRVKVEGETVVQDGAVIVPEIRIPEIRVEDMRGMSPEDRKELAREVEESQKELRKLKQMQVQRNTLERINRRRAEKGLPPLNVFQIPQPERKAPPFPPKPQN